MSNNVWFGDELSNKIKEDEDFHQNSQQISQDVIDGELDILTLIERLGGVLTDQNPEHRMRGMVLFTRVVSHLPSSFLSEAQLRFIADFYTDRLKDSHHVVPPTIEGLLSLIRMDNLPKDVPCKLLTSINQNIPCQQQVRTDRTNIYLIFKTLLENYMEEIKTLGPDLVYTILSAIDGERDPRNLLLLFTFLPHFLTNAPLFHLTEEMFDVIACYYPVDFNPSQDDPNPITRNDLADKLCMCLCGTPDFAQFCLPLLLEKLDSDLKIAKLDSLKLLTQSCQTFKTESYKDHLPMLWTLLQKELNNKSDSEIHDRACEALSSLIRKICDCDEPNYSETFLKNILDSTKLLLADAKTKPLLVKPLQILLLASNASKNSCVYMLEHSIPLLILHHHLNLDKHLQVSSFEWFLSMFEACKMWNVISEAKTAFKEIPKMCFTAFESGDDELKVACFKNLSGCCELIDESDLKILLNIIDHHLNNTYSIEVVEANKNCLVALAQKKPALLKDFILNKLEIDDTTLSNESLAKHLDVLCAVISINDFTDVIVRKFLQIFESSDIQKTTLIFSSLHKTCSNEQFFDEDFIKALQEKHKIIQHIIKCIENNINLLKESLENVSELIITIFKSLQSTEQTQLLEQFLPELLEKLKTNDLYIVLLEAILNCTKQDVNISTNVESLIQDIFNLTFSNRNQMVQDKCRLILGNLFNKYLNDEQVNAQYTIVKKQLMKRLENEESISKTSIDLCAWICKSLFLNGHVDSKYWLNVLITLLHSPIWSSEAAKSFKLIVTESPDCLNVSCHCKVSPFYRQKVFHGFTESQIDRTKDDKYKESYLLAYAYILQAIPKTVVKMEAAKISSILIESLSFSDPELLRTNLTSLSGLIEEGNTSVKDSLQSLIPRALKLTSYRDSMQVRIASLQCLFSIAHYYPCIVTLPYKEDVLLELAGSLDDHKRLVRGAAVRARGRWYLVGAPGEEKVK